MYEEQSEVIYPMKFETETLINPFLRRREDPRALIQTINLPVVGLGEETSETLAATEGEEEERKLVADDAKCTDGARGGPLSGPGSPVADDHCYAVDSTWDFQRQLRNLFSFACNLCWKVFRTNAALRLHSKVHSDARPYSCSFCEKSFKTAPHLKAHRVVHSSERPYSCPLCDKTFKRPEQLRKHQVVHSEARPHACMLCGKAFKTASGLALHEVVHYSERPYACNICGKSYKRPQQLRLHQVVHSEERPHACQQCPKAYRRAQQLKIHQNAEHARCNHCEKSLHIYRPINLKSHLV